VFPDGRLGMACFRNATNDARFAGSADEGRSWAFDVQVHAFAVTFNELSTSVPGAFRIAPLPVWARDPRGLAGAWFDPATSGQGLSILRIPGGVLTVSFFGYRNDGGTLWLLGVRQGPVRFGETMVIPMDLNRGGRFGGFTPGQVERVPWGTLTLRFDSCALGEAILDGLDGRQVLALTKLVGIDGLGCD
jgi:hypothetical protein